MTFKRIHSLNRRENIKVLRPEDVEEPLDDDEVKDIEGDPDNDPLVMTEIEKVKDVAKENGLEIVGDREMLSGGSFGPMFKLKARELESGQDMLITERTFTEKKDIEKRFYSVEVDVPSKKDSEPRYEILNKEDSHKNRLIIDYLYNEAQALKELQGIRGIPEFYGAVHDGLNGSILEEYIEGDDLTMILLQREAAVSEVIEILEKLKKVYTQAAERGFIHNDPSRCTVMVDKEQQPYIADWYLYSRGNIEEEGPIRDKYLQGLQELETLEQSFSSLDSVA